MTTFKELIEQKYPGLLGQGSDKLRRDHIREKDGTLDDTEIETYWHPIESISFEGNYFRFQVDAPGLDYEVRLTIDDVVGLLDQIVWPALTNCPSCGIVLGQGFEHADHCGEDSSSR